MEYNFENNSLLMPNWYENINVNKSLLKTILIVNNFQNKDKKNKIYDISNNKDGSIMAYLAKNKIIISNNSNKKILADNDMKKMFVGCNKLKKVNIEQGIIQYYSDELKKTSILQSLDKLGYVIVTPETGSMMPIVRPKYDKVVFKKANDYKKNDIVLYMNNDGNKLIMHRIRKVFDNGFLIHGDASNGYEYVLNERVYASVSEIYKKNKVIKRNSLRYNVISAYSVNYNKLLFKYRRSNNIFFILKISIPQYCFNR